MKQATLTKIYANWVLEIVGKEKSYCKPEKVQRNCWNSSAAADLVLDYKFLAMTP
jgi:hypothetical protein